MSNILVAIGEALIDFIPCESNGLYKATVGGAPANVCGAFAKLGGNSRMITQLGNDIFGQKIINELAQCGVDTSYITMTDKAKTGLAFVSHDSFGDRSFTFYRNPSADMLFCPSQLSDNCFDGAFALHFCSVALASHSMLLAHEQAISTAREKGAVISFDVNLRPALWENTVEMTETVRRFIPLCDILKISREELETLCTGGDDNAVQRLMTGNVKLVLLTCGSGGAYAYTAGRKLYMPADSVKAKDTTGAGDGFIGAFLFRLCRGGCDLSAGISDAQILDCLSFAQRFAAISVQGEGAIASYPTGDKMQSVFLKK